MDRDTSVLLLASSHETDSTPAPLRYFLALFFFAFAVGTIPYARRRWRDLASSPGLQPIGYWPYSPRRWQNLIRGYTWGVVGVGWVLLAVSVSLVLPSAKVLELVIGSLGALFLMLFLVLIVFGRPRRLLSPHF